MRTTPSVPVLISLAILPLATVSCKKHPSVLGMSPQQRTVSDHASSTSQEHSDVTTAQSNKNATTPNATSDILGKWQMAEGVKGEKPFTTSYGDFVFYTFNKDRTWTLICGLTIDTGEYQFVDANTIRITAAGKTAIGSVHIEGDTLTITDGASHSIWKRVEDAGNVTNDQVKNNPLGFTVTDIKRQYVNVEGPREMPNHPGWSIYKGERNGITTMFDVKNNAVYLVSTETPQMAGGKYISQNDLDQMLALYSNGQRWQFLGNPTLKMMSEWMRSDEQASCEAFTNEQNGFVGITIKTKESNRIMAEVLKSINKR